MSKPEELRQLADKFSEGWHEGIKIDAMDVMLLSDAASELETMQAILAQQPATAIACGIPGMTKTTCPYCEQGFAFEHEQPAAPEPVVSRNPFASRCYTMSESHLSGHRLIVGFEKLGDAQDAHEWVTRQGRGDFTHPAPSVPDGHVLVPIEPTQEMMNVQTWDFSSFYSPREIWAAMLAAKKEKP